jgi:hypothetical protein
MYSYGWVDILRPDGGKVWVSRRQCEKGCVCAHRNMPPQSATRLQHSTTTSSLSYKHTRPRVARAPAGMLRTAYEQPCIQQAPTTPNAHENHTPAPGVLNVCADSSTKRIVRIEPVLERLCPGVSEHALVKHLPVTRERGDTETPSRCLPLHAWCFYIPGNLGQPNLYSNRYSPSHLPTYETGQCTT